MKKKHEIVKIVTILLITIAIVNFGCEKDEPDPLLATSIELVSGNNQTAQVKTALTNPVVVIVKDQNGKAFKGASVKFAVTEGSVSRATATTDASGNASTTWTLGASGGTQTLTVASFKSDGTTALSGSPLSISATATAEPLVATSIELVSGNNQTAQVETALANPVTVLIKDQNGDALAGTEVSFTVSEGTVSAAKVSTDANGNASTTWTLGATIGTQTLNASVTGLTGSPVAYSATGVACMDYDGNVYDVVTINTQTWMSENLKVTHYPNGDAIPLVTDNTAWINLGDNNTDDAYCYYNNNISGEADTYGALYTYAAAIGDNWTRDNTAGQGVCPDGWHLPSDAEWVELTDYLGGVSVAGGKMKEAGTTHWASPNTGATNESGFSALPGGYRWPDNGVFNSIYYRSYYWSATESIATNAWGQELSYVNSNMSRLDHLKSNGFSVRCLQD